MIYAQYYSFHPRDRDAQRKLNVTWNGVEVYQYPNPNYHVVTLDSTLSFKKDALNTKAKVNTRNNHLRKLTNPISNQVYFNTTFLKKKHESVVFT